MIVLQKTKNWKQLFFLVFVFLMMGSSIKFASTSVLVSAQVIQPIYTKEDLNHIRNDLSGSYKLMNDIHFTKEDFQPGGDFYHQGNGWIPIGNDTEDENMFTGSFDGNGYQISGLTLTPTDVKAGAYGLFGDSEGDIINLALTNLTITVNANRGHDQNTENTGIYVGGLIGKIYGGTISGCTISGSIEVISNNIDVNASGLAGGHHEVWRKVTIQECNNDADVKVNTIDASANAAGIVNWGSSLVVKDSSNTGEIEAKVSMMGDEIYLPSAGGIINYLTSSAQIKTSYNTGNITAKVDSKSSFGTTAGAGGIAASSHGLIYQSYNTGTVTSDHKMVAGGIVGDNNNGSKIIDCYNIGTIQYGRTVATGGIAGANYGAIRTSYNLGDVKFEEYSGQESVTKNVVGDSKLNLTGIANCYKAEGEETQVEKGVTILTAAQFCKQQSFQGFNFATVWGISDGVPYLQSIGEHVTYTDGFEVHSNHTMTTGENQRLKIVISGEKSHNQQIALFCYESLDDDIVSIDKSGLMHAHKAGNTKIIVTEQFTGKTVIVSVETIQGPTGIRIHGSEKVQVGGSEQLSIVFLPEGCAPSEVTWTTWNSEIATVNDEGIVTGHHVGSTIVQAKTKNGLSATFSIDVIEYPTSLEFTQPELMIAQEESKIVGYTLLPTTTTENELIWSSSDSKVATVDRAGKVTGKKVGSATITATTVNGIQAQFTVIVNKPITNLEVIHRDLKIGKNQSIGLELKITPNDTTETELFFSSSDDTIVTVTKEGIVTGHKEGIAMITVGTLDGRLTKKVIVEVGASVSSIELNQTELNLYKKKSSDLSVTIAPENAVNKKVQYISEDNTVATVDQNGKVMAVGVGTTRIIAKSMDGSEITATCSITVKEKISNLSISSIAAQSFTGSAVKPKLTIKDGAYKLQYGKDYSLKWENNKNIGTAIVTIVGKGYYTGTKKVSFVIKPPKTEVVSVKSQEAKTAVVSWKSIKGITGYRVYYATSKNGSFKLAGTTSKTNYTIKKLKSKSTVYVKVRAYKKINDKNVYGAYSNVIKGKVK